MSDHDHPAPAAPDEDEAAEAVYENLDRWRELWKGGEVQQVTTHRTGIQGWLVVAIKRMASPFVGLYIRLMRGPQRSYNLAVVNHLEDLHRDLRQVLKDLRQVRDDLHRDVKTHARRLDQLESYQRDGLADLMRYSDALFARLDQKIDRYQREVHRVAGGPEEGAAGELDADRGPGSGPAPSG